jgi:hypothetical protein
MSQNKSKFRLKEVEELRSLKEWEMALKSNTLIINESTNKRVVSNSPKKISSDK